jgi:hypothetical protein
MLLQSLKNSLTTFRSAFKDAWLGSGQAFFAWSLYIRFRSFLRWLNLPGLSQKQMMISLFKKPFFGVVLWKYCIMQSREIPIKNSEKLKLSDQSLLSDYRTKKLSNQKCLSYLISRQSKVGNFYQCGGSGSVSHPYGSSYGSGSGVLPSSSKIKKQKP